MREEVRERGHLGHHGVFAGPASEQEGLGHDAEGRPAADRLSANATNVTSTTASVSSAASSRSRGCPTWSRWLSCANDVIRPVRRTLHPRVASCNAGEKFSSYAV